MSSTFKIFLILFIPFYLNSQIAFTDKTNLLPNVGFYSWLQKGISDMNNDGKDDIVRANIFGSFFIVYQKNDSTYEEKALGQVQPSSPLSVILGDVDNDNYPEILTGGEYNGVRLIRTKDKGVSYQVELLPQSSIFTQASAMADINNDGWLDLMVCDDDAKNAIWKNDGKGNFTKDSMGIDLNTTTKSDNSGNYGIVFTDFDNDNDLDFYISKCRAGVDDPTDPRRINQLYVNNGNGKYEEKAAEYGLKDGNQTWVTEFQDIDNDGDLDAFIANHHAPSRLMLNDGTGHFTEITNGSGLDNLPDGILQVLMRDFDNDGYVDIIGAGIVGPFLYKNNGNKTFTQQSLPLLEPSTGELMRSFTIGDLNQDGFQDIYASYYYGKKYPDRLWMNNKNSNHYITFRLAGLKGNWSAVGARITINIGSQKIIREVRAGESYGISSSLIQTIGIGQNTKVDNVIITWPSGTQTKLINPKIDTQIKQYEPVCKCN